MGTSYAYQCAVLGTAGGSVVGIGLGAAVECALAGQGRTAGKRVCGCTVAGLVGGGTAAGIVSYMNKDHQGGLLADRKLGGGHERRLEHYN